LNSGVYFVDMSIIRSFLLTRYQEIDMSTKAGQIQIQIHTNTFATEPR